jgi:hypothetical protein
MAKSVPSKPTSKAQQPAPLEGNRHWRQRGRVRKAAPHLREPSAWEKLPAWAHHAICLGFLLVVAVAFWSPTLGGRTLIGGDTVQWRGTAEAMLQYERSTNVDPLWAPNVFAGMPGYLIYYPLEVPGLDSIFSGLRSLGLWPLAHFLALLGGTYFLVFFLTRGKIAGALAAVAYGLTTYMALYLIAGHNSKFIALCYAPWLLLAFAAVLYRPDDGGWMRSLFLTGLFAIAAAMNLRAGHVQITYYVSFAAMVWWLAEGVAAARLGRLKAFAGSTAILALGAALALAMCAQPYLVQWEYKAFTIRGDGDGAGGGLAWEYAMAWSQGVGELLTLLVPHAYGGGGATYWGPKLFTAGPHYVGPIVLLLAVFGVFGVARRATTGLGIAALLMVLFALGEHLPLVNRPMFELFPLFSAFRVPETWLIVVALVLAVLAGYGAYWLQRREATEDAERRKTRWLYVGLGATAAALALLYLAGPSLLDFVREGEAQEVQAAIAQQAGVGASDPRVGAAAAQYLAGQRAERLAMLRGDAGRALLFLALAAALVVLYRRETIRPWVALWGLALLVTVDLWGVARRYFNDDTDALRPRRDVAAVIPEYDFDRFLQNQVEMAGGPGSFRVLPLAGSPREDARSSYFYESLAGYHGAKLTLYEEYLDRLLLADGSLNENAVDLLSARYVVARGALPGLVPVFQSEETGLLVLENPDYLPRAFFVDSVAVIEGEEAMLTRLRDPGADLRRTAYVYSRPPEGVVTSPIDSASVATVALQRYTPREIVWKVETDRPRLLVATEVYYPAGWHATVDGAEAPILRVDHLLRGVPVPAGEHLVAMRFDPPTHQTGLLISLVSSLLVYLGVAVLGGLVWYRRGHPRR